MGLLLPCAAVARQGAYSEKRPGRPSQRAVLFGGPLFLAVSFQSDGQATVHARGQKDVQNRSSSTFQTSCVSITATGTIDPNPTVAGPPPTHNLLLLPMRIYRHCQRGRNRYLRICRCICSFLTKRLANLLGGYSYVALVHPVRSQLFP